MHAMPVDPRISRWEVDQPAYHVYFWQLSSNVPDAMWASDEWRLTEADVHEVLAWAEERARGRRVTVWVEVVSDGKTGLVRISGWEPTRSDDPPAWAHQ
jgi:hypothetical protein